MSGLVLGSSIFRIEWSKSPRPWQWGPSCARASSSRFGATSLVNWATPVTLPPGRLRLGTRPSWTGLAPVVKTMGIVKVVEAFATRLAGVLGRGNDRELRRRTRSSGRWRQAIEIARCCRPQPRSESSHSGPRHSRFPSNPDGMR